MNIKVFVTPAPIALVENKAQSLLALIPNSMISELQQDRDEQLQHVLASVKQRGGHCLPTPWEPHDEHCHAVPLQWSQETRPHLLDNECQPLSPADIDVKNEELVRLAIQQKPYLQQDGMGCGTVLRLLGIQYCSVTASPKELGFEHIAELFRQSRGNSSTGETLLRSQFVASFL